MKKLLLTLFTVTYIFLSVSAQESKPPYLKEDFVGTWIICYALEIEEKADTLRFEKTTRDCRADNCGEHQWSFRTEGAIDFIFTKGCENGFSSVSLSPKRWVYIERDNLLKLISNDGYLDIYTVEEITKGSLTIVRRRDLE